MPVGYEPIADTEIALGGGRKVAYAVWGDSGGETVFLFHGAPGSRRFAPDPRTTSEAGVRLVTVDRPGYGGSSAVPGRRILDWPADLAELADALEAPRFRVVAHSSGGPYALACALHMPDRVSGVALVSCVAPYDAAPLDADDDADQALTRLAQQDPERCAAQFSSAAAFLVENPERFLDLPRPEPDVELLNDPEIRSMFVSTIREAVRQGLDAYGWECALERRSWGFELADVAADVSIWHGEEDRAVPQRQAAVLNQRLPRSELRMVPDTGHGLILAKWADIMRDMKN